MGNKAVMQLAAYLAETGETIQEFATRIGESPHTIGKLYRGERFPRVELAQRIIAATEGKVTADDMLATADEYRSQKAA
jgi:transcriptional regulator with XRE-family HTH domain